MLFLLESGLLGAVSGLICITIGAGLISNKAARLDPMEALRAE